ncbi:MAG: hypothetical protein ACRENX_12260 [Candidatus Dormibacteria bacterium]
MTAEPGRGSWWDHPRWPAVTTLLICCVAPVVVATGVTAHYRTIPASRSLAALGVAIALGLGLRAARFRSGEQAQAPARLPGIWANGQLPLPALLGFAVAMALAIWLAATTAWWLLVVGAAGVSTALVLGRHPAGRSAPGRKQVAMAAASELLAVWGTVYVEMGHLDWLGVVAAILPASLVTALLVLVSNRDRPFEEQFGSRRALSRSSPREAVVLFQGSLILSLAVPLLITIPGLDGAECFLPWLLAPFAEGPLRNSRAAEPSLRERAVRQTALLLLASSALLAVGVWAG